jgi:predicted nuclease of predicted toxin-antitoxin system
VKFVVDAQLPPRLAETLRKAGFDAVAVREIGLREAKDAAIWKYALENNAAVLTKDADFAERAVRSNSAPIVVWLRIGNATNAVLFGWLVPFMPAVIRRIEYGDRLIEVAKA